MAASTEHKQYNTEGDWVNEIVDELKGLPGPLLPILHAVQDRLGCISPESVSVIAKALNLSRAEVHGVVSFYHFFRSTPPGKRVVSICRAEACQSMGAQALITHALSRLGVNFHETTSDQKISLEPVYCLGNCACSPSVMIDGRVYGKMTPKKFDDLLELAGTRE